MRTVSIQPGSAQYDAIVGAGLHGEIGAKARGLFPASRCTIVADANTAELFAGTVMQSLRASDFAPVLITIPAGEKSKSLVEAGRICDEMEAAGLDRTSFVVALGGGVVGDLAGFAAAIYRRGIPLVQAPTTLLAQVDSAIGGKSAVNTAAGKNLLGVVRQPALVLADIDSLRTLPPRELRQGFAEVIKYAIIADPSLLDSLGNSLAPDFEALVARNLEIKASFVAGDEHDTSGQRAALNFGHTIGHAIERAAGYGELRHGEAVSLGIVAACDISVRKAGLVEEEQKRVIAALQKCELPTRLPADLSAERILAAVRSDKKFEDGRVRFVVTDGLGSARLTSDVTMEDIEWAVQRLGRERRSGV